MVDHIDISRLTLEELSGVVNIYPWYGGARKELCVRMSSMGDGAWPEERYAEAAMYVESRRIIADLLRKSHTEDYSDANVARLLKELLGGGSENENASEVQQQKSRIVVVGGDYFSQSQYDDVRKDTDNIFSSFALSEKADVKVEEHNEDISDFFTETLAQVYLEQGYKDEARKIYSKLLLRYPEKNAYFAALIAKLDEN